jgi:hypothetical protein
LDNTNEVNVSRILAIASLIALGSTGIRAEVQTSKFQNRDAWVLAGRSVRVTVMQSGGHIGEIALTRAGAVNPLWIPKQPTIDADQYDRAKHQKLYGGGPAARLLASLLGHNVCFPFWGDPSPTEEAAGMTFHGETGIVRWNQTAGGGDFLTVTAHLPESGTSMTRTYRVKGQVVEVEATARNEKAWDRPVGWCEHVTLGPPFLERGVTEMEASLTRGRMDGKEAEFRWPAGMAETSIDLRKVRKMDQSPGFVNHFEVDPQRQYGYLAAYHPKHRLVFGYVFPRAEFAWLNVWEANSPEMLTRGLEFSNTPVHGTLKALAKTPELWGTPTFDWLNAKGELRKRFWAFSVEAPQDFRGIADVRFDNGRIEVVEQGGKRTLTVPQ